MLPNSRLIELFTRIRYHSCPRSYCVRQIQNREAPRIQERSTSVVPHPVAYLWKLLHLQPQSFTIGGNGGFAPPPSSCGHLYPIRTGSTQTPVNRRFAVRMKKLGRTPAGLTILAVRGTSQVVRPYRFGVHRWYSAGYVAPKCVFVELAPQPGGGTRLLYRTWIRPRNHQDDRGCGHGDVPSSGLGPAGDPRRPAAARLLAQRASTVSQGRVALRSLHRDTMNERLDYFGSVIKMAARLERLSSGKDVVVSDAIRQDPEVAELLSAPGSRLVAERFEAQLKGFDKNNSACDAWHAPRLKRADPAPPHGRKRDPRLGSTLA